MNGGQPDMTYSEELQQKIKTLDKFTLKNIWIKQLQWNTVTWLYLEQQSFFDVYWEEPLPERNHKNIGNHS